MGRHVADLLVSDALWALLAAAHAVARRFIAVCEARTCAIAGAAIAQICADTSFADESVGTRVVAAAAVANVSDRVHALFVAEHQRRLAFGPAVRHTSVSRWAWKLRVRGQKPRVIDGFEALRADEFVYA
jgi:hypothetical protein